MLRTNTDWYVANRNDTNPLFADDVPQEEYTSLCARWTSCAFRYIFIGVLYVQLGWACLFMVLSLYGFAHFESFKESLIECSVAPQATVRDNLKDFCVHHVIRLALQMAYGLGATTFALIYTRLAKFNIYTKVLLTILAIAISLLCFVGNIQELVWPLEFNPHKVSCDIDWYILWLYCAWPWYTATLGMFIVFIVASYIKRKWFIVHRV